MGESTFSRDPSLFHCLVNRGYIRSVPVSTYQVECSHARAEEGQGPDVKEKQKRKVVPP